MIALLLAIPLALLAGLLFALIKAPRVTLITCGSLMLLVCVGWNVLLHAHRLGHVPRAFDVWRVVYAKEDAWGFGPGGNEAGFIAYALPRAIAQDVAEGGLDALKRMPIGGDPRNWRGRYHDWRPTPIESSPRWTRNANSGRFDVLQYVCAYGFCIDIDATQLQDATIAVNSPGNYYAYGRIGVIVVVPRTRRVYYFYNG